FLKLIIRGSSVPIPAKIQNLPSNAVKGPKSKIAAVALVVVALLVGAYGGLRALPILDVKPYVQPQDQAVLGWLRDHSPPDALVLGNGFGQLWGPEAVQGSDA